MADYTLVPSDSQLSVTHGFTVPTLIENAGQKTKRKFVEFFTAEIENDNTRAAYAEAVDRFLHWCVSIGISLESMEPTVVAAYFRQNCPETRTHKFNTKLLLKAKSTKKQHLAAVRQMFDHLVRSGVFEYNPASSVRGPKLVVKEGKTPVFSEADARTLLESFDLTTFGGLRDRAIVACTIYAFARIGAVMAMDVEDVYENGRTMWLRLHEKGGKHHEMPAHHKLAEYIDAYVDAADIRGEKGTPLFRTMDRKRNLTKNRMLRQDAWGMIKRRLRQAGLPTVGGCHSGRATGLTSFIVNGGAIEDARQMANHASSRTTNMYVRVEQRMKQEEVERVRI